LGTSRPAHQHGIAPRSVTTANTMSMTIRERRTEIAVLKRLASAVS
jgi:hypothetical protein